MTSIRPLVSLILALACAAILTPSAQGSAFVQGAYYRLGDDDPGAAAGAVGNDFTVDSFINQLNLSRFGSPRYSSDVPARGPVDDKLSMAFANIGLGGPAVPGFYGRQVSLGMDQQGFALEAWAKAGPTNLDAPATGSDSLIAYNGDPSANGFGLFQSGTVYVARIGTFQRTLGPSEVGVWHHLAYVYELGNSSYYYDGQLVAQSSKDPTAAAASGGFWIGGMGTAAAPQDGFNGWIDEVRYQSFNPIVAGAFNPTDFLINNVPEPSAGILTGLAAAGVLVRRRRPARSPN